ncbi:MAG TPA: aminotransferase class IV [Thermoanaerobaculia bacterium]
MPDILYINGSWSTTDAKVIGVEDRGLQFGDSVYEALKFLRGAPLLVRRHYARMRAGLEELEIPTPWSEEEFLALLRELIARSGLEEGLVYVQVTRGEAERAHFWPEGMTPTTIAYARKAKFPDAAKKEKGIAVITVPDERWGRCNVKATTLLPNALAKKKAQRAKADEALFVSAQEVTEGASSTFFAVREGRLITRTADWSILAGTVRDEVIDLALNAKIRVDERPVREAELYALDEAFITSTSLSVMPVTMIDGRLVGSGRRGPLTARIQRLFDDFEIAEAARVGRGASGNRT